jgi:hypothetical protein
MIIIINLLAIYLFIENILNVHILVKLLKEIEKKVNEIARTDTILKFDENIKLKMRMPSNYPLIFNLTIFILYIINVLNHYNYIKMNFIIIISLVILSFISIHTLTRIYDFIDFLRTIDIDVLMNYIKVDKFINDTIVKTDIENDKE